jgi:hypothetical protein
MLAYPVEVKKYKILFTVLFKKEKKYYIEVKYEVHIQNSRQKASFIILYGVSRISESTHFLYGIISRISNSTHADAIT